MFSENQVVYPMKFNCNNYGTRSLAGGDSNNDSSPAGTGLNWIINSITASDPVVDLTFDAVVNSQ